MSEGDATSADDREDSAGCWEGLVALGVALDIGASSCRRMDGGVVDDKIGARWIRFDRSTAGPRDEGDRQREEVRRLRAQKVAMDSLDTRFRA